MSYNEKSIIIIGNGFDLAHKENGLYNTSFEDYRQYLFDREKDVIVSHITYDILFHLFESIPGFDPKWKTFEASLANIPPKSIQCLCPSTLSLDAFLGALNLAIQISFEEWVDSIKLGTKKYYSLSPVSSYFVSFNYTETLERVYGIPNSSIFYIHSQRNNYANNTYGVGSKYIFGHGESREEVIRKPMYSNSLNSDICDIRNFIAEWEKDYQTEELEKHLWEHAGDVKQISIIGHGMGVIDKPYFLIIKEMYPNATWRRYCYDATENYGLRKAEADKVFPGITICPDSEIILNS